MIKSWVYEKSIFISLLMSLIKWEPTSNKYTEACQRTQTMLVGVLTLCHQHKVVLITVYHNSHKHSLSPLITQRLMLYRVWCYTEADVIQRQMLYRGWCYTEADVIQRLMLYRNWCYTEAGAIQRLMLYRGWCYTEAGAIQRLMLYRGWGVE